MSGWRSLQESNREEIILSLKAKKQFAPLAKPLSRKRLQIILGVYRDIILMENRSRVLMRTFLLCYTHGHLNLALPGQSQGLK